MRKHRNGLEYVSGISDGFDFDARYRTVRGPAVAWVALGWEPLYQAWTCIVVDPETGREHEEETGDGETVPDIGGRIGVVMVGDDHIEYVDRDELKRIERRDYCGSCGQIGCTHDGLDRTEDAA